ncbi:alkylhydroperoxidase AhpD family core domain-containing protein [Thermoanaerobacter thermohydrosulfuricus]|uniref:Alkylhydroperoxidase AhpD family core domain protein n=3 Tax=Thermoanaerobacter TaxID=1754 RepID=I8QWI5_9THEO|nr:MULTISPECIES: carboxymuconolactone decarboxylase family protein [Thermoanaerobacter]HHY81000.1 carboxymuconolactone decarboxylase family protein [Thermoanaerobacter sp.]EIV99312.1 alkylhydroperoxidase AhpD family core domain protein [Thermoanaerobacter siderophilus SR4]EMT39240.1 alkylhydroperoxidase AhpD family core domain protein [Thermoanaerobacter thermohydrosulfuricus WC1]UZQ83284.1 carboxymuconolactone decarboxylase family protein [Thermoanaerobacter sp. RKWS2]SDG34810.1 alkylhydroper
MASEGMKELERGMGKLGQEIPSVMKAFNELHHAATTSGALSTKEKELIALGIAVAIRCSHCILAHVNSALQAGATRQEIMETLGVAVLMSGGPGVAYATEALKILEEAGK